MRLKSRFFFSVQNRGKSTGVTRTKFLESQSKVHWYGRNHESSLGIDSLSSIFESAKFRESLALSYPLKTFQRKSQKLVWKTRFWPVFDFFSAQEVSLRVGTVRNRFYASNYVGWDWNLEIFSQSKIEKKCHGFHGLNFSGQNRKFAHLDKTK